MPTPISIRERIERQVYYLAGLISGLTSVQRFDARGKMNMRHLDCIIDAAEDDVGDDATTGGANPFTSKRFRALVFVVLAPDQDETKTTAQLRNQWVAALEDGLIVDMGLLETGTTPATNEVLCPEGYALVGTHTEVLYQDRAHRGAGVEIEYKYRTYRNDPYSAPGVAQTNDP